MRDCGQNVLCLTRHDPARVLGRTNFWPSIPSLKSSQVLEIGWAYWKGVMTVAMLTRWSFWTAKTNDTLGVCEEGEEGREQIKHHEWSPDCQHNSERSVKLVNSTQIPVPHNVESFLGPRGLSAATPLVLIKSPSRFQQRHVYGAAARRLISHRTATTRHDCVCRQATLSRTE